jgi:MFS family permease
VSVFWRFWTASAVSEVGSGVTSVALPLTALLLLNASSLEVGLISGCTFLGWAVLGLPAGVICQLLPLRRVQVATDLIRAAAIGSVPIAWAAGGLTVIQLIAVALVISFCNVLFDVSNSTFIPAIVDESELTRRNSWMSGMYSTTQIGGASLAGLLVQALGAAYAMVVDAVSYLGSAVILSTLPEHHPPHPGRRSSLGSMIKEGWHYVVRQPIMRACLLDATASNFLSGALLVLTPVYLVRDLHARPLVVGLVLAAEGVGGVLGAAVCPRLSARWGTARAAVWGSVVSAVLIGLLPLARGNAGLVLFATGNLGFAAGGVVTSVNTRTYRQVASPPELLSRVMATVRFVSWGVVPVGSVLAGALAETAGNRLTLTIFCALAWLSPLVLLTSPVRGRRDLDDRMRADVA